MTSEMLLAICAAVGVFIDLMFRLIAHLDDLHLSVRPHIVPAQTPEAPTASACSSATGTLRSQC
jgi:hypothetical protein